MRRHDFVRRGALERQPAGERFVRDHAGGVDVHAVVGVGIARRLFRRHVGRGAHYHAGHGDPHLLDGGPGQRLGDAEVGDQRVPAGEQHVARLDVAVHDAVLVGQRQRVHDAAEHAHRRGGRHVPVAIEPGAEALAVHERHDVVGDRLAPFEREGPHRQHWNDVGMMQAGGVQDLEPESLEAHSRHHFRRQHLDRDFAAECHFLGPEDARHAAATDFFVHAVGGAERRL